MVISIYMML